jgi:hypothetical protein
MLISASQLIGQSFRFYFSAKNFKQVMPYIGLLILLVVISLGVPITLALLALTYNQVLLWVLVFITALAGICAMVYGSLLFQIALFRAIKNVLDNKTVSIKTNLKTSQTLILPYFGTSLLQGVLIFLGYLFFIIPGIVLTVWFSFAKLVSIYEPNKEGAAAIRASKVMVAGRWWGILWRWIAPYVVLYLFIMVFSWVLSLPFQGLSVSAQPQSLISDFGVDPKIMGLSPFESTKTMWTTGEIANNIITNLLSIVFTPLLLAINVLLDKP